MSTPGSPAFAVDAGLVGQLEQRLQNVREEKRQILRSLEPGTFRERYYVTHEARPAFIERERAIGAHLQSIRQDYEKVVNEFRADETSSVPREQMEQYRAFAPEFARVLEDLTSVHFVDVDLNSFGSLGGERKLLYKYEIAAVGLTPFDFTVGFTKLCESARLSGLVLFHSPRTGQIDRFEVLKTGLAIKAIDSNGHIQVQEAYQKGISSAFDPGADRWITAEPKFMYSSTSVYNPESARVEVKWGDFRVGVAGIFNPKTRKVEWAEVPRSGIAGYFDPTTDKVVWTSAFQAAVACIWRDDKGRYDSSYGFTATAIK